ncbi:MAG: hypothetical protein QXG00_06890 [Candidatus Woesearchaeota archaeon]
MNIKILIVFTLSIFLIPFSTFLYSKDKDTSYNSKDDDFFKPFKKKVTRYLEIQKPYTEANWGISNPSINKDVFDGTFESIYEADFRLGYQSKWNNEYDSSIIDYTNHYFFLAHSSSDLISKKDLHNNIEARAWKLGFMNTDGYGYKISGQTNLIFYHSLGLQWTKVDFLNIDRTKFSQVDAVETYNDYFHFGEQWESGIKLQLFNFLSLNANYERQIIYPRHMFWYWTMGKMIEGVGYGLLESFTQSVMKSSTWALPVVNFILKSGLSYGIYELKKDRMNWPFETVSPLMYDNFKVGISFNY